MDQCNNSENVIMHSILCVKVEPFEEDEDCTQNLDPLAPDSKFHTQMELLQHFKTEIETDGSDQTIKEPIQEDILKNYLGDSETKTEEINLKTECIDNEASLADVLDSRGIKEDDNNLPNQLGGNGSSSRTEHRCVEINKQTGEKNATRCEPSHSCRVHRSDIMNEETMNEANALNATSPSNHSTARSDICSSRFDVLRIHKHSSSEEEESKQSSSLIAHSLLQPSYVCDVCDKKFKNSRNLVNHKVVHTGKWPQVCDVCKKGFRSSSHLAAHKIIHTDQKPFVCDICEKRFRHSHHLTSHQYIHTGPKPHVCDICEKGFGQLSSLVRHKRIHSGQKPYVCNICQKNFSQANHLATHELIHTDEKPFACDVCQKKFRHSCNLTKHKLVHAGQEPYACDI